MRYILDKDGYIYDVSFGAEIECDLGICTEYTGEVPEGYTSIEEWHEEEIDKLNAWKIVDGNLVFDEHRYNMLQAKNEIEIEENQHATHKWVNDTLKKVNTIYDDELSKGYSNVLNPDGSSLIKINDAGNYEIPEMIIGTKGIETSVKGSSITIDDVFTGKYTDIGHCKEFKVYGKSTQETRSGKNVAKIKTYQQTEKYTYNKFEYNNISVTKKATGGVFFGAYSIDIKQAGTYTFSGNANFSGNRMLFYAYSDTLWGTSLGSYNLTKTGEFEFNLTFNSTGTFLIGLYGDEDIGTTYQVQDFMCRLSTITDKTYEPYGASPSPDYPSEIISIPSVENLFDKDNTLNGYVIHGTGKIIIDDNWLYQYIEVKPNTAYVVSGVSAVNTSIGIAQYDSNKTFISSGMALKNGTFTTSSTTKYIAVSVRLVDKDIYQIEKGSIPHPYVPFGNYLRIDNVGKNLFKPITSQTLNGISIVYNEDGSYTLNGTSTAWTEFRITLNKELEAGDYTLICRYNEVNSNIFEAVRTTTSVFIATVNASKSDLINVQQITTTNDKKIGVVGITINNSGVTLNNFVIKPMLVKGKYTKTNAPTFEPYRNKVIYVNMQDKKLCSIGDVRDELIIYDNGKTEINKKIGEVILDGSESGWTRESNYNRYKINIPNSISESGRHEILSDYFICNNSSNVEGIGFVGAKTLYLYPTSDINTVELWKTWLSNNPVKVQYVLETPEEFTLEPTRIELYEGVNNISLIDDLETELELKYYKDKIPSNIKLKITNENILENKCMATSLDGIEFTINKDKSITLNGTATKDIEFILNGSLTNEEILFFLKAITNYRICGLSSKTLLNLYSFDGTDRELIYSGSNGTINFNQNKYITCASLGISSGSSFNNLTIYPMVQFGEYDSAATYNYVEYKGNDLIDIELLENYKAKNDIIIERESVSINYETIKYIDTQYTFNPNTLIQFDQDIYLTLKYFTQDYINTKFSQIEVEQEKILLEVGNKVGKDSIISSINMSPEEIKLDSNRIKLAEFTIEDKKLTANVSLNNGHTYTSDDVTKVQNYIKGTGTLTDEEIELYDLDGNEIIDILDLLLIQKIVVGSSVSSLNGVFEINTEDTNDCIVLYNGDEEKTCSIGTRGAYFNNLNTSRLTINGEYAVGGSNVNHLRFLGNDVSSTYLEIIGDEYNGVSAWGVNLWASDKRLKNSIEDTQYEALELVNKIKHRQFKYNNSDKLVEIGYIADELEELDPSLIFKTGEKELKQPKESYIIPILSKAIQELSNKIDELETRIKELENKDV